MKDTQDREERAAAFARQILEPQTVYLHRLMYWMNKVGVPRHGRFRNDLESYVAAHHGFSLAARWDREPDFDVVALLENDYKNSQREWTTADTIARWANLFRCSRATLSRRLKDGTIPNKKLSSKMYMIAVEALPAEHRDRLRAASK